MFFCYLFWVFLFHKHSLGVPTCEKGYYFSPTGNCARCEPRYYCPNGIDKKECGQGYYSSGFAFSNCLLCPDGTYTFQNKTTQCTPCNPGTYSIGDTKNTCISCPINTYSLGNASMCVNCTNELCTACSSTTGYCTYCIPGSRIINHYACEKCSAGTYSPGGITICEQCQENSYALVGQSQCSNCDSKCKTCDQKTGNCLSCYLGSFVSEGICISCEAGYYNDGDHCFPCNENTYAYKNSTKCITCNNSCKTCDSKTGSCLTCNEGCWLNKNRCYCCQAGNYYNITESRCIACLPGTFSPNSGSIKCEECKEGMFTSKTASTSCSSCDSLCKTCDKKTGQCTSCYTGYGLFLSNVCEICEAGFYSSDQTNTCLMCLENTYSLGGTSYCTSCNDLCKTCDSTNGKCTYTRHNKETWCVMIVMMENTSIQQELHRALSATLRVKLATKKLDIALLANLEVLLIWEYVPFVNQEQNQIKTQTSVKYAQLEHIQNLVLRHVLHVKMVITQPVNLLYVILVVQICLSCINGYGLNGLSECFKCNPGQLSINSLCQECEERYYQPEYGQFKCNSCDALCATCNKISGKCITGNPGYELDSNNNCIICKDKEYSLNNTSLCISCPSFCINCIGESGACTSCQSGLKDISNGSGNNCISCSMNGNCSSCDSNEDESKRKCVECDVGYFLDNNNCYKCSNITSCEKCSTRTKECLACSGSLVSMVEMCVLCEEGKVKTDVKKCSNCYELIDNCQLCDYNNGNPKCSKCFPQFVVFDGKCILGNSEKTHFDFEKDIQKPNNVGCLLQINSSCFSCQNNYILNSYNCIENNNESCSLLSKKTCDFCLNDVITTNGDCTIKTECKYQITHNKNITCLMCKNESKCGLPVDNCRLTQNSYCYTANEGFYTTLDGNGQTEQLENAKIIQLYGDNKVDILCKDNFVLLSNNKCSSIENCTRINGSYCVKCTEYSHIANGKCVINYNDCFIQNKEHCIFCNNKITVEGKYSSIETINCQEVVGNICKKCEDDYYKDIDKCILKENAFFTL
ncbi:furin, putative [Entamoeba invadens IP1]|uniref:furin, putative n=1 Tax=Entamoeba invadens IP1 TaxID=370355 RepID=UPI0002C3EAE2|nr:furin, putative [Entamoeba invadens IP1]ELP90452.1 furin, putative [Entamoeba invadens IP1]|eukprot:XP_004257223.1 furin, putative [Entamoeba invadens IP1]